MIMPSEDSVRRPISLKIFGIAATLLLLMIVITLFSSINLHRMGQELSLLSDYYIKLDQLMGDVRTQSLREMTIIERVINKKPKNIGFLDDGSIHGKAEELFKEAGDCEPDALRPVLRKIRKSYKDYAEQQLMAYQVTRLCTKVRLENANALVKQMLALPKIKDDPEDIMRLATIRSELDNIMPVREKLNDSFEKYLKEIGTGEAATMALLQERLEENRREVSRRTSAVSRALHAGTRDSAARAKRLENRTLLLGWIVTFVACTLGLLVAFFITRNLVRPVLELLSLTKSIRSGNLDVNIQIKTADEIGQLADSFSHMVGELKQKEMIKKVFGKYVDPRIVQYLLHDKQQFDQSGQRQTMSVFFSDMEGFTAMCEGLTPTAIVRLLNLYFSLMAEPIRNQQGIIDKYIGDSVMAFWGPPFITSGEYAKFACFAALQQQEMLPKFHSMLPDVLGIRNVPNIRVRMGIATGDVTVGSIGSEDAQSYTVIGDTVNLGSRIEGLNKHYRTKIMICEKTRELAGEAIEARVIDTIRVAGKTEPVKVYELIGRKGEIPDDAAKLCKLYEQGLTLYRERKWSEARSTFEDCLKIDADDSPSQLFIERIEIMEGHEPPDDWDGVWTFTDKYIARHK